MAKVVLYRTQPQMIAAFAELLRDEDLEDERVLFGEQTVDQRIARLDYTARNAAFNWSVFCEGKPFCIGGVNYVADGGPCIWQLGTALVERRPVAYTRVTRSLVNEAVDACGLVGNYVRDQNTRTRKWLANLGFTFGEWPVEINGHMWWEFVKAKPCAGILAPSQIH